MSKVLPTPRQIERWVPCNLSQIIGCNRLKKALTKHLQSDSQGTNILVAGDSGTGKTSACKAYIRTLICPNASGPSPIACGKCSDCRRFDERYDEIGLFTLDQDRIFKRNKRPLNYVPVNCGMVTESQLRDIIRNINYFFGDHLIYLDEVHRIVRRQMDHLLLKPLEEMDAVWIASTARVNELDGMFIRRFATRVRTSLPAIDELAYFLAERCSDWRISLDDPRTLVLVAQLSGRNTAECISLLAQAAGENDRRLSRDLVEQHFCDLNSVE